MKLYGTSRFKSVILSIILSGEILYFQLTVYWLNLIKKNLNQENKLKFFVSIKTDLILTILQKSSCDSCKKCYEV